jgi:Family of unknown function (DUF5761)
MASLGSTNNMQLPYTALAAAGLNGRVANAAVETPGFAVPGFAPDVSVERNFQTDMLRGNWESSPVSDQFFSAANVEILQNQIRKEVYDRSQPKGYVIDKQSVEELKIIMRAIYLQYARNLPSDIGAQVADLNQKVCDWSVPHILSAVDHYFFYINDISHMPVPLAHSQNLSSAGTRSLPMQPFM